MGGETVSFTGRSRLAYGKEIRDYGTYLSYIPWGLVPREDQ
jgi:hypothetical protein